MRVCRHCSHQNADHLSYCSACGRRLSASGARAIGLLGPARASGAIGAFSATAAMSRTVLAARTGGVAAGPTTGPRGAGGSHPRTGGAAVAQRRSRLGWTGESIGYIYVYLRAKIDAGERRRRLGGERDGAETMLAGAVRDLGGTILREGVQHPELTGLLEAIGRAQARREAAANDITASEKQKESEETRLAAQEAAAEAEWRTCDAASRDADEVLRTASADHESTTARLARVRDERVRLERETNAAAAAPDGQSRAASLKHDEQGLAAEQRALDEQRGRLERQLADLREKSAAVRGAAARARAKLDQQVADRRQAAAVMAATISGHIRDRADAEHEAAMLTEQLGRVAADARPASAPLLSAYQRIDRLKETISDREQQIEAVERASAHHDIRKLLAGVALLTGLLLATAAVLWAVLKR
jgi:hypothetical protein